MIFALTLSKRSHNYNNVFLLYVKFSAFIFVFSFGLSLLYAGFLLFGDSHYYLFCGTLSSLNLYWHLGSWLLDALLTMLRTWDNALFLFFCFKYWIDKPGWFLFGTWFAQKKKHWVDNRDSLSHHWYYSIISSSNMEITYWNDWNWWTDWGVDLRSYLQPAERGSMLDLVHISLWAGFHVLI